MAESLTRDEKSFVETIEGECGADGMKSVLLGDIKIIVP